MRGVRENGGQYTHAAVWAAMAFAALGDAERAWELFTLINPVNHAKSPDAIALYKTEPYVLASDVYALAPHTGRGGWTWYTGSAGWMYQLILESLLGLRLEADKLHFSPCVPADWNSFQVHYRYRKTVYHITVVQTSASGGGADADGRWRRADRAGHSFGRRPATTRGRGENTRCTTLTRRDQAENREEPGHNQPPVNPARRNPVTT